MVSRSRPRGFYLSHTPYAVNAANTAKESNLPMPSLLLSLPLQSLSNFASEYVAGHRHHANVDN